jgi:hypothetical protein
MSMLGGYSAALPAPTTATPIAGNRPTTSTAQANSTALLGNGGSSSILKWCIIYILVAIVILLWGRWLLRNARIR